MDRNLLGGGRQRWSEAGRESRLSGAPVHAKCNKSKRIIYVIDPDEQARARVAAMLAAMQLEGRFFESADEFLEEFDPAAPGCIMLDLRLRGLTGIKLQRRLLDAGINIPQVFYAEGADLKDAVEAMRLGAVHFLDKNCREAELWDALQEACEADEERCRREGIDRWVEERLALLSPGERSVLDHMLEGYSKKQIASKLGLSVRTIELRRSKIMSKTGVWSIVALTRLMLMAHDELQRSLPEGVVSKVLAPANHGAAPCSDKATR